MLLCSHGKLGVFICPILLRDFMVGISFKSILAIAYFRWENEINICCVVHSYFDYYLNFRLYLHALNDQQDNMYMLHSYTTFIS